MTDPTKGPHRPGAPSPPTNGLSVLAVDDEPPALAELAYLLTQDPRIARVQVAGDGATALRVLQDDPVDAVFLDIRMPGLTGLDLARVLGRFAAPPAVVFVTAYDDSAVDAFDLRAVDYLLKPVHGERLGEAIRRVLVATGRQSGPPAGDDTIPVELGGVTRFVSRRDVLYVEAQGDYARLHTARGSHLVRVPLSTLEEQWGPLGFVRIHRSLLVAIGHIDELRIDGTRCVVRIRGEELTVSRRHTRELRDLLVRHARPGRERR